MNDMIILPPSIVIVIAKVCILFPWITEDRRSTKMYVNRVQGAFTDL